MIVETRTTELFRVTCVRSLEALAEHRAAWNRLAGGVPFRRWEWCETWWRHYAEPGWQLHVLLVSDSDGSIVGIAPCYLSRSLQGGRVLRFIGGGEVCGDFLSLLAVPGLERPVAQRVAACLGATATGVWDSIHLEGVTVQDSACRWLVQAMRARGCYVDQTIVSHTWRVPLRRDWDGFVGGLSKHARRKVRTLQRHTIDAGRVRTNEVTSPEDLSHGLHILRELHQRRRLSLGQRGCFSSQRFADFHAEVAARFLKAGALRLRWLELDGQPAAAEYGFTDEDTIYLYQSGFDPAVAEENPGWLQTVLSLRNAGEAGYRGLDFLRGDEPYKAAWGAVSTPLVDLRIINRHWGARLRHMAWQAGCRFKSLVRQRFLAHAPASPLGEV